MARRILANVTHRHTRVAILENGRVSELMVERGGHVVGNVYKGRVENIVPGLDAAFVECGLDKNVFVHVSDALPEEPPRHKMRRKMNSFPPIGDVLKQGEEVMLQVVKGPVEDKGARGTRRISLPGRYLVLMTDTSEKVGVSKKIEDDTERKRLRDLAQEVCPEDFGIIVRTRAQGATKKELQDDVTFLTRLWRSIQARARQAKPPALVHEDLSLVLEVLRDVFSADVSEFMIDDKVTYDKVLNLLDNVAPSLRDPRSAAPFIRKSGYPTAAGSTSSRPKPSPPLTSTRANSPAKASRTPSCAPTWRQRKRSPGNCACATSAASLSLTLLTWTSRSTASR